MANGRKYIGMTTKPVQRTVAHLSGNGASATKNQKITSINHFKSHPSVLAAKKAETKLYYKAKASHGASNVRGAGHTVAFSGRGNRFGNA
jgi:predicted GIY-YIG superfamily endonuclease